MARKTLSMFLFAAVSIALFGFIAGGGQRPSNTFGVINYLVDTPAEYEHFRKGLYYVFNDIFVEAGAHPDVLSQAQHAFSNTRNNHILFRDERGDYIYLTPRKLFVNANFTQGNLFAKLPTNYKSYVISVTDDSVITEADKLAIAQWHSATDVRITKKSDE